MAKRVRFLRTPGGKLQGVYDSTKRYIVEGDPANPNEGGGFIGRMELAGGLLYIRKVDKDGKPHRNYGRVSVPGGKMVDLLADGIAVSSEGYVMLFDDEKDSQKEK